MILNYANLEFDSFGRPETPVLELRTLAEQPLGTIPFVSDIKLNIKFSEPSELTFQVAKQSDGDENTLYDAVSGYKIIWTKCYGVYVIMGPESTADGLNDTKSVKAYSLEKLLDSKKFFLEEGTYNFWNPASQTDTILGRVFEIAEDWSPGYVSPSLIGKYRTFDSTDEYLLSFVYNTVPDKFRCVFVFDTYSKTINVYDADEERSSLPIYLDFNNLVQELHISERTEELVTALRPYGADDLTIYDVSPTGKNWIYDLSYFVSNGDIQESLATKWDAWQKSVLNQRQYYSGLVGLRASATAQLLAKQAALTDLNGEMSDLVNRQSVTIQALASETSETGKATQQALLDSINAAIAAKQTEINGMQAQITSLLNDLDSSNPTSYASRIQAVVDSLAMENYFTSDEYAVLKKYMIEQDVTEETFVASDFNMDVSGENYTISSGTCSVSGSSIARIDMTELYSKQMYTIQGGTFALSGNKTLTCDIIRGTMERKNDGTFVLSLYAGRLSAGDKQADSGTIVVSGFSGSVESDIAQVNNNDIITDEGTEMSFYVTSSSLFLTANAGEYQQYAVELELYDYAAGILRDVATPTYEFSVNSGNFLFDQEFKPFRDKLVLGNGIYLRIDDSTVITPLLIEIEFEFEDRSNFTLTFSNRFKRHDNINTLKDMIESSYSSGRSFDSSKYLYQQSSNAVGSITKFLNSSLDAARNSILAAQNQNVVLDGTGLLVYDANNTSRQIRLTNGMIAMTDDNWATAKLAIGYFASESTGAYYGVNAEVIGGKLIVGNNLIIENENDDGVMQFKVDATGAWLRNGVLLLESNSGQIMLHPNYGIMAGPTGLYTLNGTTVTPSTTDTDNDGLPDKANFYLDMSGNAYFRGHILAKSGKIGGFTINENELVSNKTGYDVGINGNPLYSTDNPNYDYAFWAGSSTPSSAKFYVKKDGTIYSKGATLDEATINKAKIYNANIDTATMINASVSGTLNAPTLNGNMTSSNGWLVGCGLAVGDVLYNASGVPTSANFFVDSSGNVTIKNGSISWGAVTGTDEIDNRINSAQTTANTAVSNASTAQTTANTAQSTANTAITNAASANTTAQQIANGTYSGGTFINGKKIYSPEIYAGEGGKIIGLTSNGMQVFNGSGDALLTISQTQYDYSAIDAGSRWMSLQSSSRIWISSVNVIFNNQFNSSSPSVDFNDVYVNFTHAKGIYWGNNAPIATFG